MRHGWAVGLACWMLAAAGQYPDLNLGLTPAMRDSLLKEYDNVFPILGRKALEHGVRLQAPLGINLDCFAASRGIAISNLGLAVNDGGWVDMSDVIKFDTTTSDVENVDARVDLWVLPFLNLYGMGGYTWASTAVEISAPAVLTSRAEMEGTLGVRVGKNYRWRDKSVAAWVGAMTLEMDNGTQGTVRLADVFPEVPPELGDRFEAWYDGLTPPQQEVVDGIRDGLDGTAGDTEIHYRLDKAPTEPWTMAVGAQIEFSRQWQFRTEFNFLGDRTSILTNIVYRIDL